MLPSTDTERLDNKEGSRDMPRSPGKEKQKKFHECNGGMWGWENVERGRLRWRESLLKNKWKVGTFQSQVETCCKGNSLESIRINTAKFLFIVRSWKLKNSIQVILNKNFLMFPVLLIFFKKSQSEDLAIHLLYSFHLITVAF